MQTDTKPLALIVDDNPENLKIMTSILRQNNFKVAAASGGMEALGFVKEKTPDIILLDIMMPGLDGFETCRQLKAEASTSSIPILFISALSDTADKLKGFEAGGVDYITKPFQKEEIVARVHTHLLLKQSLETIKSQNRKLEELNASKDKFFSIIAHDLKSPFNGFIGMTQLFLDSMSVFDKDEMQKIASEMNKSAVTLYRLIENLLAWACLQRGIMQFNPKSFEIAPLIEDCVEALRGSGNQKSIRIECGIPTDLWVFCDDQMLHTVVRNLISNAIKFTDTGGRIVVTGAKTGNNFIEIAVRDNGIGMSEVTLGNLFRMDVDHRKTGTNGEKGTGLGLLLCRELVEKNGGIIDAESEMGKGSTFRVTLPYRPS